MKEKIEETLKIIDDEAANRLADAIILRACDDYRNALLGYRICKSNNKSDKANIRNNGNSVKKECERFFMSDWYKKLTYLDEKVLIKKLQSDELQKVIAKYDEYLNEIGTGKYHIEIVKQLKGKKVERYEIPPRLMDGFIYIIAKQLQALKEQLEELNEVD